MHDVAIVGGGLAGMATALLLQARGLSTVLIEAHSRLGGCAGFYARSGFSFDIGATTLVDFHEDGLGTPRSYANFTSRPRGAIGGARLSMHNADQHAVPYALGRPGFWLAGDTTWPGLGTVACVLGARHVAEGVQALAARRRTRPTCRGGMLRPATWPGAAAK